jgi:polysaccharide pyruvyl transferase WcaK-like protein
MGKMKAEGYELIVLTGAKQYPAADDLRFVESLAGLLEGPWRHVQARSLEQWIETIGTATLLVSGRFHHTLAAFTLRTPFVMLTSNTNKMVGLQQTLNAPKPLDYNRPDLYEALLAGASQAGSKEYNDTVFKSDRLKTLAEMALRNVPSGVAMASGDHGFGSPHEEPTLP